MIDHSAFDEVELQLMKASAGCESDMVHLVRSLEGCCAYLSAQSENLPADIQNDVAYFIGVAKANNLIGGMESKAWDKIKEKASSLYEVLLKVVKSIKAFFSNEGKQQLRDAKDNSNSTLEAMSKIDATTPINENSRLLLQNRYFKVPSLENLEAEDVEIITTYNRAFEEITNRLKNVSTVGNLISVYKDLQKASLKASDELTLKINKAIGETHAAIGEMMEKKEPKSADGESVVVEENTKQKSRGGIDLAKQKAKALQRLASLRNKFLAPCFVITGSLANVESLKNKNQ